MIAIRFSGNRKVSLSLRAWNLWFESRCWMQPVFIVTQSKRGCLSSESLRGRRGLSLPQLRSLLFRPGVGKERAIGRLDGGQIFELGCASLHRQHLHTQVIRSVRCVACVAERLLAHRHHEGHEESVEVI